jgi:hypothetical protein
VLPHIPIRQWVLSLPVRFGGFLDLHFDALVQDSVDSGTRPFPRPVFHEATPLAN